MIPSGYNPHSAAPQSAHIAWTKEVTLGGLVGGEFDSTSYYAGIGTYITPPIIMNGKLYYRYNGWGGGQGVYRGFYAVDMYTGEDLWQNQRICTNVRQQTVAVYMIRTEATEKVRSQREQNLKTFLRNGIVPYAVHLKRCFDPWPDLVPLQQRGPDRHPK